MGFKPKNGQNGMFDQEDVVIRETCVLDNQNWSYHVDLANINGGIIWYNGNIT